ncbi:MAG: ribosomal protein S18-alanine N-acetyltransferase [Clostridia bacterium]|nr:ribosomal protein S18-alanine N-acetyltransferase [Clostridia bacterium]
MTVTKMQATHVSAVAEIEKQCFTEPWSEQALGLLLTEDAAGVVCELDGAVVAYGGMIYSPFDAQITNVAVLPQYRRCGCGRAVLEALIAMARARGVEEISLEVRVSNEAAIALYRAEGFLTAGVRKGFYRHPTEDAAVMLLTLSKQ